MKIQKVVLGFWIVLLLTPSALFLDFSLAGEYLAPRLGLRVMSDTDNRVYYIDFDSLPRSPQREFLKWLRDNELFHIAVSGGASRDLFYGWFHGKKHKSKDIDFTVEIELSDREKEWILDVDPRYGWPSAYAQSWTKETDAILRKVKDALEPLAQLLNVSVDDFLNPKDKKIKFKGMELGFMGLGGVDQKKEQDKEWGRRFPFNVTLIDKNTNTLICRRPELSINLICIHGSGRVMDSFNGLLDLRKKYARFLSARMTLHEFFRFLKFYYQYDLSIDPSDTQTDQRHRAVLFELQEGRIKFRPDSLAKAQRHYSQFYKEILKAAQDKNSARAHLEAINLKKLLKESGLDKRMSLQKVLTKLQIAYLKALTTGKWKLVKTLEVERALEAML